jgi:hypothetical protein
MSNGGEQTPVKLHYILNELENRMDDIVSWQPHGTLLVRQQQFVDHVLPL